MQGHAISTQLRVQPGSHFGVEGCHHLWRALCHCHVEPAVPQLPLTISSAGRPNTNTRGAQPSRGCSISPPAARAQMRNPSVAPPFLSRRSIFTLVPTRATCAVVVRGSPPRHRLGCLRRARPFSRRVTPVPGVFRRLAARPSTDRTATRGRPLGGGIRGESSARGPTRRSRILSISRAVRARSEKPRGHLLFGRLSWRDARLAYSKRQPP